MHSTTCLFISRKRTSPLGGCLDLCQKPEQRQQRPKYPQRQIERAGRQQQRAAAEQFQERANGMGRANLRRYVPCNNLECRISNSSHKRG
jgi:hypothetical protein